MYDDGLTEEERQRRRELEYDEGDDEAMQVTKEERVAQIELANYGVPTGGKVWHARLPNFLELNPTPFDPESWQPQDDVELESQGDDSPAPKRKAPVPDENVIRWKWTQDELGIFVRLSLCTSPASRSQLNPPLRSRLQVKESNSRIVRWSDGSLSLQVGAELFDISLTVDHSAVLTSTTVPVVPSATSGAAGLSSSTFDQNRGHGLTYLVAKHDYTDLLEAQASVHGTLTFRPTTLQSNTHRRLATSIASRNVKGRATKVAQLPTIDPEKLKAEREKAEVDKAKKAKREAQKSASAARKKAGGKRPTRMIGGFSDDEGDEEDGEEGDEEGYSRSAAARSQPRRGRGGPLAREDEYEDEDEDGFVRDDDEEEEQSGAQSEGEPDEMDEAEARIEREERRRREQKARGEDAAPAPAPRRRLVVDDSDDEE